MAAPLGEYAFQAQIVKLMKKLGYEVWHVPNCKTRSGRWSNQSATSMLDLEAARPPRFIKAEVKGPETAVTDGQRATIALLGGCPGVEVYLWRSGETSLQAIAEILAHRRRPDTPSGSTVTA
jgi:hypothetical protein